ncbi:unnamed protein product [Mytilus edulis]|uniref:Mab-21-like HhH/H2TH-like domain-containing protein n=1 Tax=Mytilus edulis TaxID=6550 RepID=A0A8S3SLW7_MYTED|nr:unnamed protein product [Mytilus edulis]
MTTDLSQPLYDYLCKKIGTEDIVKVRRLCYAIFEYLSAITPANSYFSWISSSLFFTYIYSGSKADGLDLKGSDTDIMGIFHCVNVFENPLYKLGTFSCHTSTDYTKSGFVRLKPNFLVALLAPLHCKQRDGQVFLSSELVKTMAFPLIRRFCSRQQQTLVDLLTDIYQKGIYCFLNSETLSDFFGTNLSTWTYFTGFDYELINTAISILNNCILFDVSPNTVVYLFSRYKLVSHRYLYTLYWCAVCQHIGHTNIGIQERSNKDQYKRYKTYLPYIVMGLQKDAITGWLCLASHFFSVHNYKTCLNLIDYILQKCCFGEHSDAESHIGRVNNLEIEAIKYGVGNAHDICSRHFVDLTTKFQLSCQVRPEKLQLETVINLRAISSPFVYTHFLRFMCCHHLRDFNGVPYALRDLQRLISKHQFDATFCLGLAYATLKEYATALSLLLPCSMGLKSSNDSKFANLSIELDLVINKLKRASS